jgi:hypothetical protein
MSLTAVFLTGIALTAMGCIGLLAYVSKHLRTLLIELCGSVERAQFWLAFSNVALVLVPLISALNYRPQAGPDKAIIFEIAAQLQYALVGFVVALSFLALVLISFVRRTPPRMPGEPAH